jgi:hypothetical protein
MAAELELYQFFRARNLIKMQESGSIPPSPAINLTFHCEENSFSGS